MHSVWLAACAADNPGFAMFAVAMQSYREGLQLLCQAYDSDPRNPAVLNLLAHYCLTRKEYSKVSCRHWSCLSHMSTVIFPLSPCNKLQHIDFVVSACESNLNSSVSVGQASSTECSELRRGQPKQSTKLSCLSKGLSRRWPNTRCRQLLLSGKLQEQPMLLDQSAAVFLLVFASH